MRYLPDTSVIVDGRFVDFVKKEDKKVEVLISRAVIAEIEHHANMGRAIGFSGLRELKALRELHERGALTLKFVGERPYGELLKDIDNVVREEAKKLDAILVTGDRIQHEVAVVEGIKSIYIESKKVSHRRIEDFFDSQTMSVHLKESMVPLGKKGKPGEFVLTPIGNEKIKYEEIVEIANDIVERGRSEGFIEIDTKGATVVQLRDLRIVITRPPFSDSIEITAVRPIKKLSLEEYKLPARLLDRLKERAEGILVAGPPGAGKSTFVQALAEYYASLGKIVKTMEKPRDLQVSKNITQYTTLEGSMEKTGDILLLVRPDYTIFDEMRTTEDFRVFTDLRLAGVGMVGVVHATRSIDAIQRFIGRVELGIIPQIVDTVIFIKAGGVQEVLVLNYVVKVPSGMTDEDLARPVIEVKDFFTEKILYEIYSFGEQVVVVPVVEHRDSPVYKLARERLEEIVRRYVSRCKVEIINDRKAVVYVPEEEIASIVGRDGRNIGSIERRTEMSIDVRKIEEKASSTRTHVTVEEKSDSIIMRVPYPNRIVRIYLEEELVAEVKVSKNGTIKLKKSSELGEKILDGIRSGKQLTAELLR